LAPRRDAVPLPCHPTGGLEISLRRLKGSHKIGVLTLAEVTKLLGVRGDFTAKIKVAPCDVDAKCIAQPADDLRDPARGDRRHAAHLSTPAAGG
jgi:heterodisulfide reductase subunit A-like polyferredoxin